MGSSLKISCPGSELLGEKILDMIFVHNLLFELVCASLLGFYQLDHFGKIFTSTCT